QPRYPMDLADATGALMKLLQTAGRDSDAQAAYREGLAILEKVIARFPDQAALSRELLAQHHDARAWFLVTARDPQRRNPREAIRLAKLAVESLPTRTESALTLGVALYRAGEWKLSRETLEKAAVKPSKSTTAGWFFLAMDDWQLGSKKEARRWYDKDVALIQKGQ